MKKIAIHGIDGVGKFALVYNKDFEYLKQFNWMMTSSGYPCTSNKRFPNKMMHHFIIAKVSGMVVDHINGNKLDNRRYNLRLCTYRENSLNVHHKKKKYKFVPKKGHGYKLATFPIKM